MKIRKVNKENRSIHCGKRLAAAALAALMGISLTCGAAASQSDDALPDDYPLATSIQDAPYFGDLKEFSSPILGSDEEFTQENLKDYDLTIINFWATWCGPCRMELPGLAEYQKSVPDNIQMITCCIDAATAGDETVQAILDEVGYEGITLTEMHGDLAVLNNGINSIPTTLFFDSEGRAVGYGVIGAVEDFKETYTYLASITLHAMGIDVFGIETEAETEAETETEANA